MLEPLPGDADAESDTVGEFAPRLDSLDGARLVYLDLGKPNGPELFESLNKILEDEFNIETMEHVKKHHFSSPMTDENFEEVMSYKPDAVIESISDCGSCNSSSVVDAVAFESLGIPTVQVITDNFLDLNKNISQSYGYEELPLVCVPHPTRYLEEEEVKEIANRIKWSIETTLTCDECLVGACPVDKEDLQSES